ncbi:MAG: calcium/sodium antiporter [Calditrichia bacterium]
MILQFIIFLTGLGLLWLGAELLVRYASRLAASMGVSPVIIGLSVVSMGTSAPEMVVSIVAVIKGNAGISIGNIVGSNITNLGLILGIGAIIQPMQVKLNWVKREIPFMIVVSIVFIALAYFSFSLDRIDSIILLILMGFFLYYLGHYSAKEMASFKEYQEKLPKTSQEKSTELRKKILYLFLTLVGVGILVFGSDVTVTSGKKIAEHFGVSDLVIGLTLVALGTSLPELATTLVAALRKETDLLIGNVIGSNIFNLLLIGGVVPLIHPIAVDANLFHIQFPILLVLSILIWPMMRLNLNLQRYEGLLLLILYFLFIYVTFR